MIKIHICAVDLYDQLILYPLCLTQSYHLGLIMNGKPRRAGHRAVQISQEHMVRAEHLELCELMSRGNGTVYTLSQVGT